MSSNLLDATLLGAYSLTPRVKQLLLQVDGHTFDHRPGQHLSVRVESDDGSPTYRPYSPVSLPGTDRVALAVKRYDEGTCSVWLHERTAGDPVSFTPPSGNLHLHDADRDVAFLATGTGLTPMLAMLSAYEQQGSGRAVLVFGERTEEDLMYRPALDRLSASRPDISVQYVLSDAGPDWGGRTGYVQDHLDPALERLDQPHVYVCGVPEMVVETRSRLEQSGISDEQVFTEGWEEGAIA